MEAEQAGQTMPLRLGVNIAHTCSIHYSSETLG